MSLIISGKDFKLTPALKQFVTERTQPFSKYDHRITQIKVELDVDHNQKTGDIHRVQLWVTVAGTVLRVGLKSPDMRAAIDQAAEKMIRQLVKQKEKKVTARRSRESIRGIESLE